MLNSIGQNKIRKLWLAKIAKGSLRPALNLSSEGFQYLKLVVTEKFDRK